VGDGLDDEEAVESGGKHAHGPRRVACRRIVLCGGAPGPGANVGVHVSYSTGELEPLGVKAAEEVLAG
jgi:hypothetical protein